MIKTSRRAVVIRIAVSVLLLGAAVFVLGKNWQTVQRSLDVARSASILWLVISLLLMCLTFVIAAAIYGVLALHHLRYGQTVLVEVATAFVNKLLPAGIGGLGLHGVYLYKRGHTAAEATAVVSVNNLVGMAAHILMLAVVIAGNPDLLHQFVGGRGGLNWRVAVAALVVIAAVSAVPIVRRRTATFMRHLFASIHKLRVSHVVRALGLAALLTATYTLILFAAARSIGIDLSVLQVLVVFSVGMLTATATPTPGGLVGAEAGLFAGFVAYGVSAPLAGAVVLLYRLVSYWLPLIPGAVALAAARRTKLV